MEGRVRETDRDKRETEIDLFRRPEQSGFQVRRKSTFLVAEDSPLP